MFLNYIFSIMLVACVAETGDSYPTIELPVYNVNLDVDGVDWWADVLEDFISKHGTDSFEQTYGEWMKWAEVGFPELCGKNAVDDTAGRVLTALTTNRQDLEQQLEVLSTKLLRKAPNVTNFKKDRLALAASNYILGNMGRPTHVGTRLRRQSACTSTLVVGAEGLMLHGRSLDYEPRTLLAKVSVEVNFVRNGTVQYRCFHPLVYPTALGWVTCERPGHMSLSVNARSHGTCLESGITCDEMLRRISKTDNYLLGDLAMKAIKQDSYDEALKLLSSANVVSSNYFILAGAGKRQGAVITRYGNCSCDGHSCSDVWEVEPAGSSTSDGQKPWMRVQTNIDHNVSFESQNYSTYRRQHVIDMLNNADHTITRQDMWNIYLTNTAFNTTSYVTRMRPEEDTGAVLRPTTIASFVMSPATKNQRFDARVWAKDPVIQNPGVVIF